MERGADKACRARRRLQMRGTTGRSRDSERGSRGSGHWSRAWALLIAALLVTHVVSGEAERALHNDADTGEKKNTHAEPESVETGGNEGGVEGGEEGGGGGKNETTTEGPEETCKFSWLHVQKCSRWMRRALRRCLRLGTHVPTRGASYV